MEHGEANQTDTKWPESPVGLCCPSCHTELLQSNGAWYCRRCGQAAVCREGQIPDFLGGDGSEAEPVFAWSPVLVERVCHLLLEFCDEMPKDEGPLAELRHLGLAAESNKLTPLAQHLAYHLIESRRQAKECWYATAMIGPEARVLDVGGGAGQTLRLLETRQPSERVCLDVDLVSLAFGLRMAQVHSQPIQFVRASAHSLPFPDARFTHVICRVGMNYMQHRAALSEMSRVLVRGGMLMFRVEGPGFDLMLMRNAKSLRERLGRCLDFAAGVGLAISGIQAVPGGRLRVGRVFGTLYRLRRLLAQVNCSVIHAEPTAYHRGFVKGLVP